uniref:Secreted protein n=1 Tax=Bursaphelenchus xylophilus TaxID=6326 RepID=A0A1I7SDU5_BURXY
MISPILALCSWLHVGFAYHYPISCFSCASEEYEQLYQSSKNSRTIGIPVRFDKMCNRGDDVRTFSPAVKCDSACVTVLEPQYFGGKLDVVI